MTPLERFTQSLAIDYEKWHDGIGYDLAAIRDASQPEREAIERALINRSPRGWREIEALAALDSPRARDVLAESVRDPDAEVRAAVLRHAPDLVSDAQKTAALVRSLSEAVFYSGLSQTLGEVEDFHPPAVIAALLRGTREREGSVAVHFAAMLAYLHGKAAEPFDMVQRPFFLRFHTEDRQERDAVFRELCEWIGVQA